jgi:hypothetical protein
MTTPTLFTFDIYLTNCVLIECGLFMVLGLILFWNIFNSSQPMIGFQGTTVQM